MTERARQEMLLGNIREKNIFWELEIQGFWLVLKGIVKILLQNDSVSSYLGLIQNVLDYQDRNWERKDL